MNVYLLVLSSMFCVISVSKCFRPPFSRMRDLRLFSTDKERVRHITYNWVKEIVFGLNLCPFSGAVLANSDKEDKMRIVVHDDDDSAKFLESIYLEECRTLAQHAAAGKTTLLVLPSLAASFEEFLALYEICEDLLEADNLDESIQLASFHPSYQFADTEKEDVTNYTNRSPFPVIHLLRIADVREAIESYEKTKGATDAIYEKNMQLMRDLGTQEMRRKLQGLTESKHEQ